MGSGWGGVPCIIGPTARSACTRSIACWASRCCNTCIGRPKRHGPASRWRTCWKSCVRSRNLSCSTPRKVTRGQTGSPPCSPNRRCRSKPWPKRWAWSNCVLPRVGNTADRSQPVTKTRPYAFVLALPSKLPLEAALKAAVPGHKANHRLGIFNLAGADHLGEFQAREPAGLDALVLHRGGLANGQIGDQVDGHALLYIAGADPERRQLPPRARAIAGFLNQLASRRLERLLAGIEASGWQLPQVFRSGQPVLPHQQHAALLIHRHHHGGTHVAHHGALDFEMGLEVHGPVFGHSEPPAPVDFGGRGDFNNLDWSAAAKRSAGSVFRIWSGPSQPRRAVT